MENATRVLILLLTIDYILIFFGDNSSSSHTDNRQNDFLVLDKGPTDGINGSVGAGQEKLVLNLVKQIQSFT